MAADRNPPVLPLKKRKEILPPPCEQPLPPSLQRSLLAGRSLPQSNPFVFRIVSRVSFFRFPCLGRQTTSPPPRHPGGGRLGQLPVHNPKTCPSGKIPWPWVIIPSAVLDVPLLRKIPLKQDLARLHQCGSSMNEKPILLGSLAPICPGFPFFDFSCAQHQNSTASDVLTG